MSAEFSSGVARSVSGANRRWALRVLELFIRSLSGQHVLVPSAAKLAGAFPRLGYTEKSPSVSSLWVTWWTHPLLTLRSGVQASVTQCLW